MPTVTNTTPAHGCQVPDVDCLCTNAEATVVERGEVMVLDQSDSSATATNFKFGDIASAYSVARAPLSADANVGMFAVALARIQPGGRGPFRQQGKVRLRTSGTPGKGQLLICAGGSRVLVSGLTGHVGKKVIARVEVTASGTPEFADVLFDGLNGFGAAPI